MSNTGAQTTLEYVIWSKQFYEALKVHLHLNENTREDNPLLNIMAGLWKYVDDVRQAYIEIVDNIKHNTERDMKPKWIVINTMTYFGRGMSAAFRADNLISMLLFREVHPVSSKYVYLYNKLIAELSMQHDEPLPPFVQKEIDRYLNGEESWTIDRWINGDDRFCQLLTTDRN